MTNSSPEKSQEKSPGKRSGRMKWIRWMLFAVLLVFALWQVKQLWQGANLETISVRIGPLFLAGLVYLIGWLPAAFFWRALLMDSGQRAPLTVVLAAHYCGHLGKYVPGKAMAILIRADLLKPYKCQFGLSCATAVIETLASMAVGLGWGLLLLPACLSTLAEQNNLLEALPPVLPWNWLVAHRWEMVGVIAIGLLAGIPLLLKMTLKLSQKFGPSTSEKIPIRLPISTFLSGLLMLSVGWWIHGFSLWLVLHGLGADQLSLEAWPLCTASAALATSVGFAALIAPGGLVVREAILATTLQPWPEIGTKQAIAAGIVLRLVWVISELIACGVLYWQTRQATTETNPTGLSPESSDQTN